jgi:hypothetical protein
MVKEKTKTECAGQIYVLVYRVWSTDPSGPRQPKGEMAVSRLLDPFLSSDSLCPPEFRIMDLDTCARGILLAVKLVAALPTG